MSLDYNNFLHSRVDLISIINPEIRFCNGNGCKCFNVAKPVLHAFLGL